MGSGALTGFLALDQAQIGGAFSGLANLHPPDRCRLATYF
jgi:hypothetical protein